VTFTRCGGQVYNRCAKSAEYFVYCWHIFEGIIFKNEGYGVFEGA